MLQKSIQRTAVFDPSGRYRYRLERYWHPMDARLTLIMLNPSRADAKDDDPTLRRCIGLAQRWGYGGLVVVNLFAYCTADPRALKQAQNPIGVDTDAYLLEAAAEATTIGLAWGNGGGFMGRDRIVCQLLSPYRAQWHCLGRTQTGHPRHPLYVPRSVTLIPWSPEVS
ncbi:hypothetical protein XM38_001650 [Halomicronema hongdechloris C2206]|uniref:DUF1643 domain-containing protein n=1 Tax=Halomicronema hongdechloris C2206 TaxID=1641165 RepID=A0A1Z3HG40_9CYAN|nr:DUF1643 domain-containing protein [Halomicronema hongdechloris]ASC69238.1 hypothetical protein XM38_001650 [Halomicronema hongdechloris C2206]